MTEAPAVVTRDLTMTFDAEPALDGVDLTIRRDVITGLIGRNGAGKSTLLALVAGLRRPTSGTVRVDGEDPFENAVTMADTQLVRESGDAFDTVAVSDTFAWYADLREHWDADLAAGLADALGLDTGQRADRLSRGQRSSVGAIIGLAARAPLTIFDETYLGMDAVNRRTFYDALLADYAERPRTIIVSSHLIGEVERMFEDVVMLDAGRVLLSGGADDVRATGLTLTGPSDAVEPVVEGLEVVRRTALGPTTQIVLRVPVLDPALLDRARAAGVEIGGTTLEDLFIDLVRKDPS